MGLDMSLNGGSNRGGFDIHMNWGTMSKFEEWSIKQLGVSYFDILTPSWGGSCMEHLDVDASQIQTFKEHFKEWIENQDPVMKKHLKELKEGGYDSTLTPQFDTFVFQREKEFPINYFRFSMFLMLTHLAIGGKRKMHMYMG